MNINPQMFQKILCDSPKKKKKEKKPTFSILAPFNLCKILLVNANSIFSPLPHTLPVISGQENK